MKSILRKKKLAASLIASCLAFGYILLISDDGEVEVELAGLLNGDGPRVTLTSSQIASRNLAQRAKSNPIDASADNLSAIQMSAAMDELIAFRADVASQTPNANLIESSEFKKNLESLANLSPNNLPPDLLFDSRNQPLLVKGPFVLAGYQGINDSARVSAFIEDHGALFGVSDYENVQVSAVQSNSKSGKDIVKLNRTHQTLPVWGSELVVVVSDGNVFEISGNFTGLPSEMDLSNSLNEAEITTIISQDFLDKKLGDASVGEIFEGISLQLGLPIHAYRSTVSVPDGRSWDVFVSATQRKVSLATPLFYHSAVASEGIDLLGERRDFFSEKSGDIYILRDNSFPEDAQTHVYEKTSSGFAYSNSDQVSSGWDSAAVSAVHNVRAAHDYFSQIHSRESFDGEGSRLDVRINRKDASPFPCNATWNQRTLNLGAAGCGLNNWAISKDFVTHEFVHGVVETTANLEYRAESGALNESFADFFGAMVDRDDWLIGEDLYSGEDFIRSLSNPTRKAHNRAHYSLLYKGSEDYGGVHWNSGIQNRALYLMAEGLSDEGLGQSIGKSKTEQIAYATLKELTPNSRFIDSAAKMISKAEELYPNSNLEKAAVEKAWSEVGVTLADVPSVTVGERQFELPGGNDIVAFLYPRDGTITRETMFSDETYDVYLYIANQPLDNYSSAGLFGPINDYPSSNRRPVMWTSQAGDLYTLYLGSDGKVREARNTGATSNYVLDLPDMNSVAVSGDGDMVALVTDDSKRIFVYDFAKASGGYFDVVGPDYSLGGSGTEIKRVDAINFDRTGQQLIFDYSSCVDEVGEEPCSSESWSIGVLDVGSENFTYPFPAQPTHVDLGFPQFANLTNDVIVFDYINYGESDDAGVNSSVVMYGRNDKSFSELVDPDSQQNPTSAWGIPSFAAEDKAVTYSQTLDSGLFTWQVNLDNYQVSPANPTDFLFPFYSGFPESHRDGYLDFFARLNVNETDVNIGLIERGTSAKKNLGASNTGNRELELTRVVSSANSLNTNLSPGILGPQGAIAFSVSLDTSGYRLGSFTKTLTIYHSGDNEEAEIRITGIVDIDSDDDGLLNSVDPDDDNDGVRDYRDAFPLISLGGRPDLDNDGRPDDCDGQCQSLGMTADLDDDGDSMPDALELENGLNPYDGTDCPRWFCTKISPTLLAISSSSFDFDKDGLSRAQEEATGTNWQVADTDGDGLNDGDEVSRSTNPLVADTDGDGLSDGDEVSRSTDPLVADSDGDTMPDGEEVAEGLDPIDADDCPRWYCRGGIMHIIPALVP